LNLVQFGRYWQILADIGASYEADRAEVTKTDVYSLFMNENKFVRNHCEAVIMLQLMGATWVRKQVENVGEY
jgi:hypothetical protein